MIMPSHATCGVKPETADSEPLHPGTPKDPNIQTLNFEPRQH